MSMFAQLKRRKRPAPAGPKQNTRRPRKSTGRGSPLNRPAPNPTGGVAGGPSAPTRRSKPLGGYAKNKAESALRAQGAKLKKAKASVIKGLPKLGKMKPGTGTAPAKRKSPFAKGRPTRGRPNYTIMPAPGRPARKAPKYTTMPERKPKTKTGRIQNPVKVAAKRPGGIGTAVSEAQKKAMAFQKVANAKKRATLKRAGKSSPASVMYTPAYQKALKAYASSKGKDLKAKSFLEGQKKRAIAFQKVADAKKAARLKRTGKSLATTAAQVRARKAAAAKRKRRPAVSPRRRPTGGPRRPGMGRRR